MQAWLDRVVPGYGPALMWTLAALIGLLILLIAIRIFRGLTFGTFVAGGRNRKTRLAVMDATAVDSHRRLVLIRRDDVEHLILIGGPTDVVVEQNIRLLPASRRPAGADTQDAPLHAAPKAHDQPPLAAPPSPRPQAAPASKVPAARTPPAAPVAQPVRPAPPATPSPAPASAEPASPASATPPHVAPASVQTHVVEPRFASPAPSSAAPQLASSVPPPRPATVAPVEPPAKPDLDRALLEELEVSLEREHKTTTTSRHEVSDVDRSLDEEMSRLLSDLAGPRR